MSTSKKKILVFLSALTMASGQVSTRQIQDFPSFSSGLMVTTLGSKPAQIQVDQTVVITRVPAPDKAGPVPAAAGSQVWATGLDPQGAAWLYLPVATPTGYVWGRVQLSTSW